MKLKRVIMGAVAMLPMLSMFAAGTYMHVQTSDGWIVLDLDQVDRLSFADNVMTASDKNDNVVKTVPQSDLVKCVFSEESSGLETVTVSDETFTFDSSSCTVRMQKDGNFEVFSVDGKALVTIKGVKAGETVDLKAVTEGVVILKSGEYIVKTVLK